METPSPSAHCTSVRETIRPYRNSDIAHTSSRNIDVVATVPTSYRNIAANVPTPDPVDTIKKKLSHNHNLLSSKVRFTHVVMETTLGIIAEVPLAVKCFDAIGYKLLRININDIDKLMKETYNENLNTSLQNIN